MKFLLATALLATIAFTNALICRECFNALSEADCEKNGIDRECPPGESDQCQIQIRYHEGWGPGYRIFKNCKQGRACDNNYIQNPRDAWVPSQCIPTFENSVCRCCCDTDRCNVRQDDCFKSSQQYQCPLPPSSMYYGLISCTNGREAGSVCTTVCSSGGVMRKGFFSQTTCRFDGAWSKPFGSCARQQCEQKYLSNGWYSYSDSLNSGSVATAQCNYGYDLIGTSAIRCVSGTTGTRWNMFGPTCQRRRCADRGPIAGGVRTCENQFFTQSHCKVVCDVGYMLKGIADYYCQDDGFWSHEKPTCERVVCDNRGKVANGRVRCSDKNNVDSVCDVRCDDGYGLVGDVESVCVAGENKGDWSLPLPECLILQCPPRGNVANGDVTCSDDNNVGSTCGVRCDDGYGLVGDVESVCVSGEDKEDWSLPLPECIILECPPRGNVANGDVTCSDDNNVGSTCGVRCDDGYGLVGDVESVCVARRNNQDWSLPLPECLILECPRRGNVANGDVTCSDDNNVGSTCGVQCDDGYELVGDVESVCVARRNNQDWSLPLPECLILECPPRGNVANGEVTCNDDNNIGSTCRVKCDRGFDLNGDDVSNCQVDSTWSIPLPTCGAIPCPGQGRLPHGEITCSDDTNVESVCSFVCTGKDYELFPKSRDNNVCEVGGRWSRPKPCCSRPCPPYALMDLVIVLDSSSSIGAENWILLTDFVASFLNAFEMAESAARIGIFRYNRNFDTDTEILLGDFPGNKRGFIQKFREIPYDGSGTNTGKALQHAVDVHLMASSGNRPDVQDVVLLLTDGKSNDDVAGPAKAIRDTGAIVLAVGIEPPRGQLDRGQLLEIAGVESNVIVPEGGFANLNDDFALVLGKQVCGDECGNR